MNIPESLENLKLRSLACGDCRTTGPSNITGELYCRFFKKNVRRQAKACDEVTFDTRSRDGQEESVETMTKERGEECSRPKRT